MTEVARPMRGRTVVSLLKMLPKAPRRAIGRAFDKAVRLFPRRMKISLKFFKSHGYFPRLEDPKTFSEKINWIVYQSPDVTSYVDKVLAKDIVSNVVGQEFVIPTLYSGDRLPDGCERNWPIPYVVKVNNSSGGNVFVRNLKEEESVDEKISSFLAYDFGSASEERYYSAIKPQVLVEPFIHSDGQLPVDYKFFVFAGKVEIVQVDTDREFGHKRVMLDRDFVRLPLKYAYEIDERPIHKPRNFKTMVEVAEKLGQGHGFIRVDLYSINDEKIYFGEFGFTPAAGLERFDPSGIDVTLGALWTWPDPFIDKLRLGCGLRA